MSYRNKTYVAFASENIHCYRLMEAWRENENIDFSFFDAHDLYLARDTSQPDTIKRRLRERLANAKQVILLGSAEAKKKGADGKSFLCYEVNTIISLNLPVVVANLDGDRRIDRNFIPDSSSMSITIRSPSRSSRRLSNMPSTTTSRYFRRLTSQARIITSPKYTPHLDCDRNRP